MHIDELPIEMLMQIFAYLPKYNAVSLVSKRFYDVACKVNDSTICLLFNVSFLVRNLFVCSVYSFLIAHDLSRQMRDAQYWRASLQIVQYRKCASIYVNTKPKCKFDQ